MSILYGHTDRILLGELTAASSNLPLLVEKLYT